MESFLSACSASSLVKGKSNHRARVRFICMVRPKTSTYDGALSMAWVPTWTLIPVITMELLLLTASTVNPPGWRGTDRKSSLTAAFQIKGENNAKIMFVPWCWPHTSQSSSACVWSAVRYKPGVSHCPRTPPQSAAGCVRRSPLGRSPDWTYVWLKSKVRWLEFLWELVL